MIILPPSHLRAVLTPDVFDLAHAPDASLVHANPHLNVGVNTVSRRRFLSAAAATCGLLLAHPADAAMVFNFDVKKGEGVLQQPGPAPESTPSPSEALREQDVNLILPQRVEAPQEPLVRGQVPDDFWEQPRTLRLRRQGAKSFEEVEYWRDGSINPDGYWRACHVLRDVKAGMMTYMDPSLLDLLRGITGYYEAWDWNQPIIITSGYRTEGTNGKLGKEGAAKNSMHLYGKAADLYMERIPAEHLMQLGKHFKKGGVGFYPGRGFIHLDTGKIRSWRGK